jgi:hypothetical protein
MGECKFGLNDDKTADIFVAKYLIFHEKTLKVATAQ